MSDDILDVAEWLKYAESDYSLAVQIAGDPNPYYARHVCYHCQQAAEKILKAYVIAKEGSRPHMHDLEKLVLICERHCSDFSNLAPACASLDTHITTTRYPSMKKLTAANVSQALKDASSVLEFTKSKLKELGYAL